MRALTASNDKQSFIPLSIIHPRDLVCEYQSYGIGWFYRIFSPVIFALQALMTEWLYIRRVRQGAVSILDSFIATNFFGNIFIAATNIGIMISNVKWRAPEKSILKF